MWKELDSSERKFNEAQSQRVVVFMSLKTMFPDPRMRALAKAAGQGRVKKVEHLVAEGVDVNSRGTQGVTPLFWAMRDFDGFKKLLELGADPNVVYGDGNSVMHAAVNQKDLRILKAALQTGGNPNLVGGDSVRETPIFWAASVGFDVVDLLLEHGADINAGTPILTLHCYLPRG